MGEAQTPRFYDLGIFEPVTKPQNQLFLSLETPGHLNKIKKITGTFEKTIIFINLKMVEIQNSDNFGKDGRRQIPKIRVIKS